MATNDELTKRHKDLVPVLVKALSDSDNEVVQSATQALANLGSNAVPALVQVLRSPEPNLRVRAAVALGKMGAYGQAALPDLITAMQDKELAVRREAVRAIALVLQLPPYYVPAVAPTATPAP
jgi:HEAT repeat protein